MAEVKWIKFMVGTFDGSSFKRIKRAKLKDGSSYRDRLTAIWFELMDLAAKRNRDGQLVNIEELAFNAEAQYEDIAIMIDRPTEEVECAIQWFVSQGMIEIIDDVFLLSNWGKYQSIKSLDDVREQTRLRVAKWREKQGQLECNVTSNATETLSNAPRIRKEREIEEEENKNENKNENNKLEIEAIFNFWNEMEGLIHHRELNEARLKAIHKALKQYGCKEVIEAIKNYDTILRSQYYFSYKWSLEEFLTRKNGISSFTAEGSVLNNYLDEVKKNPRLDPDFKKETEAPTPSFVSDFLNSIK